MRKPRAGLACTRLPPQHFSTQLKAEEVLRMISGGSLLVSLVYLVDHLPLPPPPARRKRGRPQTYSDRLLMKALVVMIIRRLYTAWAVLAFLHQQDPVVQQLRALLTEEGQFPTRRTWERRLAALPVTLPGLIGRLGRSWLPLAAEFTTANVADSERLSGN